LRGFGFAAAAPPAEAVPVPPVFAYIVEEKEVMVVIAGRRGKGVVSRRVG